MHQVHPPPAVLAGHRRPIGRAFFTGDTDHNPFAAVQFKNPGNGLILTFDACTGQMDTMALKRCRQGHPGGGTCRVGIGVDITGREDGGAIN